ncbi:MAG: hypothetical protein ACOCYV_02165 [Planctomycetota bacterium]
MELAAVHALLSHEPVDLGAQHATFAGAQMPLVMPLEWIPPHTRAAWLAEADAVPPAVRIATLLQADQSQQAWELIARSQTGPTEDPAVYRALHLWAAREQARLGLPATRDDLLLLDADGASDTSRARGTNAGLDDVRSMFDSLPWPRWAGPLVVVQGEAQRASLPAGVEVLARPALPLARIEAGLDGIDRRRAIARRSCALYLALSFPPPTGWPQWLVDGMIEVADAKSRGLGPSPRAMARRRNEAGTQAIALLLRGARQDAELAMAVCAPLCHTKRKHRLPAFFELLRNQVDSPTALRIAYGQTARSLATPP